MEDTINPRRDSSQSTESQLNISKLLSSLEFDQNMLLPIIILFLLGQDSSKFPIVDDIKKLGKNLIDIPLNIDVSTKDIEKMIGAVNSISPYMNPDNVYVLDTFSDFLSAMHKISTVKEFKSDMTRSSPGDPRKPLKFKNQKDKALHMLGAMEQFMDEPAKKNIANFRNTLNVLERFEQTTSTISEKRKNGGSLDIRDMMQFIGPLLSGGNFPDAQKIDSMIRMVQIMSALDESDLGPAGPGNPTTAAPAPVADVEDDDDDEGGSFFEFVIDRYDDEEDE